MCFEAVSKQFHFCILKAQKSIAETSEKSWKSSGACGRPIEGKPKVMRGSVLGVHLVSLEHMCEARCPQLRQALLLGKIFHIHTAKSRVYSASLCPAFLQSREQGAAVCYVLTCSSHHFFFNGTLVNPWQLSVSGESGLSFWGKSKCVVSGFITVS